MSNYKAKVSGNIENGFYAMVVRVENDGELCEIGHYKARHFKTEKAALKSCNTYIEKFCG